MSQDNTPGIRQNFTRDLFSWSAGYAYKLDFPAWPRGMDADMNLNYSNYARDTASVVGYGWDLGMSRIYRNARKGVDALYSGNEFVADGNELVEIQIGSGVYLSKNANNLNKYTFANGKWTVQDTSGNKLVYGSMDISRLSDPTNPSKVFAWMLDSVTDSFGNRIEYNYIRDAGGNVLPKNIRYGFDAQGTPLYEVQFRLIDKTRSITSYRTQFELKSTKLLSEVALMVSGVEARKYVLSYDSVDTAYSHLVSIQEKSLSTSLPSTTFSYGSGKEIHLLTKIDNGRGGTIGLSYTPSTGYKKDGVLANNKLPILLMTLSKIDYTDSITWQKSSESFEYAGGSYYYDASDLYGREYTGFYQTTVTDDTGRKQVSYFHQSQNSASGSTLGEYQDHISKKGRAFREESYDGSGILLTTKITKWVHTPKGNARFLVTPAQVTTVIYGSGATHTDIAEWYEYDGYGNLTKKTLYGLVTADPQTGAFTDTGNDRREIQATYAMNIDKNLFSLPWQTILLSGSGDLVAKNEKLYDSLSGGLVSSGLTSEDISWKSIDSTVSTKYAYDTSGLPVGVTDANGNTSTYQYDQYHLFPLSVKNPLGWGESYTYNYAVGKPSEITDANGTKIIVSYDGFGRELGKNVLISGEPISRILSTQSYNDTVKPNQQVQTQYFDLVGQDSRKSYAYLDGFGNAIETRSETLDANTYGVSKVLYDTRGNKIMMTYPRSETGSTFTTIARDEKGDSWSYDGLDRVISQKNASGEMKYAYDGLSTTMVNQNGIPTKFSYDAFQNLARVTETNSGAQYVTDYTYTPDGKLAKLTDSMGNIRGFSYDMLGRVLRMEDLHAPASSNFGAIQFAYDNNGNILTKTTQSGENITKTYDPLGRVTLENYPSGSGTISTGFAYDTGVFWTGRLVSVTKWGYSQSFAYNGLGQKTHEDIAYGSGSYGFNYGYDLAGAVTSIEFPDGKMQVNTSSKWLAKSITFDGHSILSDMSYNAAGKPARMTYGNGIVTDYAYDYTNGYRLIGKQSKKGDKRYQITGYTFDPVGNITMIKEEWQPELQKTVNYGYDDLNRLTSANHSFTGGLSAINESYAYDPIGNMTSGPAYQSATFGSDTIGVNPHALTQASGTIYSYDARGNLTQKTDTGSGGTSQYEYNIKNEMVSYTDSSGKTNYEYDATGRRTSKNNGVNATQYVNQLLEVELAKTIYQTVSLPSVPATTNTGSTNTGGTDTGSTNSGSVDTGSGTLVDSGTTNGSGVTSTWATNTGSTTDSGTTTSSGWTTTIAVTTPAKWSYYIYLGDEKIGTYERQDNSGKYIFHLDDHLGGSNLDTDGNGEVLQITDYLPYGKERVTQRNSDYKNKYWFIGKEQDNESWLNYVEARYYDSGLGRFVAQDKMFWEVGQTKRGLRVMMDPQQMNSYGYARDNPVILKDPSGEAYTYDDFRSDLSDTCNFLTDAASAMGPTEGIPILLEKAEVVAVENAPKVEAAIVENAQKIGATTTEIWEKAKATLAKAAQKAKETVKNIGNSSIKTDKEVLKTLERIEKNTPKYPKKDGSVWINKDRDLPPQKEWYYKEWTVDTPTSEGRWERRIVTWNNWEQFYTDDHYKTFTQIK